MLTLLQHPALTMWVWRGINLELSVKEEHAVFIYARNNKFSGSVLLLSIFTNHFSHLSVDLTSGIVPLPNEPSQTVSEILPLNAKCSVSVSSHRASTSTQHQLFSNLSSTSSWPLRLLNSGSKRTSPYVKGPEDAIW